MTTNYFEYNAGSDLPSDAFRISPSQISRFFDNSTAWYREMLLGEEGFTGSTASALGNCIHAAAEMYAKEGKIHYDQIDAYINQLPSDHDIPFIQSQYPGMVDILLNEYLTSNLPTESELFLSHEIRPNIYAAGTIDSIRGTAIIDYKTTSSKSPPNKISRPYWFQQLVYAYLARKNGYTINSIRLVFITTNEMNRYSEKTGKQLKDYPSIVHVVTHEITDIDMEIIENSLNLIAESVQTWKENPEIRYLLAQDYRLKPKASPKLFKK